MAGVDRLEDALPPCRLAGMNGDAEAAASGNVERLAMQLGRAAGLSTGKIKCHHAMIAHPHRMFGDLHRQRRVKVPE